ncbi:PREDICTED: pentatricopeptide repeat-containing protein At5g14080 [Tarenaya hassleriana]|uniref:pentatricopeptide repeat-containing protein At5g14080 n=1 Tax=Tarenaya hassleriana TaxID=28532 RepID=UPI00053C564A|nr:PREDICTED: pentatricopeptide repeat-containing protein At5g14080 [Tarenaya hassleriana]XP_010524252.1 PREDICTED: pentatricopeptide repeat-containing protein At5g14080 [Tarenaya hassleriana]XP_010524255.1 PREDICTED: pentatricopeptide repeat-containing protein At5g14080 [Tarenaya hassleriana]XP_010524256.1 PREDICTED: pentatricopeptide repeat-containing protein At5g14080 [Tarenaya hassleriana]
MRPGPAAELAARIGQELLSISGGSRSVRTWNSSFEQTLHRLRLRDSLCPSLVALVIDPFLLNHHSLALGFFNWAAQQPGYSHDSVSYRSILKSLFSSRQFSAMDVLLKQVKSQKIVLEPAVYQSLIDSLVLGGKPQSAFWVLDEVLSMGREMPPDVCNRLLAALASDGCSDYAQHMFDEMCRRGIALNTLGFGVYVGRFSRNAETGRLLRLVEEVKKLNSDINGSIIALLIVHGLCKASREMDAFYILDELRNIGCKPDFMAYRIIAEAFVLTGNLYERQVVLKKKRKLGVAPRSSDYGEYILDLISTNQLTEAKELAEVIVSGNFPIGDDVLEATIRSVSSVDPDSAVGYLSFMVSNGKSPTPLTLSKLCKNLCKHNKSNHLLEVYELLASKGYFSDIGSYRMMVKFLCRGGRVREAYNALDEMKKKGFDPDVSMYNALIEACCRGDLIRPAKKLWDEMFVNGCRMNLMTYKVLIVKLSEEGEADEALRLFKRMLDKGIEADEEIYTSLVTGLCQESKIDDALQVYRKSVEHDTRVSGRVLSAFVWSLCRDGCHREASELLREMWSSEEEQKGANVVLLKCMAEAKEVDIGIQHIKWIKQVLSPSLLHPFSSDLSASLCSSSDPDSVLPFLRELEETSNIP